MSEQKQKAPFGLWSSPISPELISQGIRLQDVQWCKDSNTLVWSQSLSGKTSILAKPQNEAPFDLTGTHNPAGGVGYGGGEFTAGTNCMVFADKDGRLYHRTIGSGTPHAITPAFGHTASPILSPHERWVVYVHTYEDKDLLGLVDVAGKSWPSILASGSDFYMQPAWSPNGKAIAWVEWDHPNMPWDGTRLKFALIDGERPAIVEEHKLDGGVELPIFQPEFSPDGRYLSYIRQPGEFDEFVLLDLETDVKRTLVKDAILLRPAWAQGIRTYAWHPDGQHIYYIESQQGFSFLKKVDLKADEISQVDLEPYTNLSQISISASGKIALFAQSPTIPPRLISLCDSGVEIIARSPVESIHPDDLPQPQPIDWISSDEQRVYGTYYPPTNRHYTAEGLPPVIVYIHGGPTSQASIGFDLDAAFFTSRGYGYLVVNYRGSIGYGRSYMLALRQRWGELDTLDAVEGGKALVAMGLADPNRLVIKGGSAGGYTVLNVLIQYPHFFKAGLCSYGVSNLFTLEMDTHKFEAHYNASLVGTLPEASARFHAWSPVFHADKIKDPVAVFQGNEDKVVPLDQSETIVAALRANHVPHEYHLYEGEGHGFRKSETLVRHYNDIDRFLKQYVIFSS
jgi:dipeptidyl aminopeptidase/acylaminoacyl peptidase